MKKIISIFMIVIMLAGFMKIGAAEEKSVFSDVRAEDYFAEAAEKLSEAGIISGYPDGTFGPGKFVTRAEMAVIVCRVIGKAEEAGSYMGSTTFEDVTDGHWARGYIGVASGEKIINGDGNGKFRPEDTVMFEEAVKMIVCALGLGDLVVPDSNNWSRPYIVVAEENGILSGAHGAKSFAVSRGDVAVMINNGIEAKNNERPKSLVVNVKKFGAVGDGKSDDELAILTAFKFAANNLPATVYFPEGEYGLLEGGMYIALPPGSERLTVRGDGADKSTIVYLDEWKTSGSWVAIRIMPKNVPATEDEYLKNITIKDLGVLDTNPVGHAHTLEEHGQKEETHGFDIQYTINATIKNCKVKNVGDEAIDMVYCKNSLIENNVVEGSPGAGGSGGAISVGDGCDNVTIRYNTIEGTIEGKTNFGIAVEALTTPVKNIYIYDNSVKNVHGNGFNIGAPNGTISNLKISNNTIIGCDTGIKLSGKGAKDTVLFEKNRIGDVTSGIVVEGSNNTNIVINNTVISKALEKGIEIRASKSAVVKNATLNNMGGYALWNAGTESLFENIAINDSGLVYKDVPSVLQYAKGGSCILKNVTMQNIKNKVGISGVSQVIDTTVYMEEITGYYAVVGASQISNCSVNRNIIGLKENGVIDGLTLTATESMGSTPAIYLVNPGCTVKNCKITMPSGKSISEGGNADFNRVYDNMITGGNKPVKLGANSEFYNNTVA